MRVFGFSFLELVVLFIIALVIFGPERLPDIARTIGKLSAELRKGTDALRREFYNAVYTPAQEADQATKSLPHSLHAVREQFVRDILSLPAEENKGAPPAPENAGQESPVPISPASLHPVANPPPAVPSTEDGTPQKPRPEEQK